MKLILTAKIIVESDDDEDFDTEDARRQVEEQIENLQITMSSPGNYNEDVRVGFGAVVDIKKIIQ